MSEMKPITRKEKLIAGEDLTPITREEMFLKKYGGGASGGADWNASEGEAGYVKNRTHYEETTVVNEPLNITWDGNTEGLVSFDPQWDSYTRMYLVSDLVVTDEAIKKMRNTNTQGDDFPLLNSEESEALWNEGVEYGYITEDFVDLGGEVLFVRKAGAVNPDGIVYPRVGVYFKKSSNGYYVTSAYTTEPVEQTKTVVHKLDMKYLPIDEIKAALGIAT